MPRDLSLAELDDAEAPTTRVRGPSGQVYGGTSMLCFYTPADEPRKAAIRLVESPWFDPLILLTIGLNCSTMAWESPLDPCCTWKAHLIDKLEWIYLAIFTVELLLKVLARGFLLDRRAYMRDPWCQLDFVVVTLAWLPIIFPSMGNYSALRAFRALRPLRALKRLPGMPMLVEWILSVLPKMGNVLALFGFVFLVFGIVGMELFKGVLHYRCALPGFVESTGHPLLPSVREQLSSERPDGSIMRSTVGGGSSSWGDDQDQHDTLISCNILATWRDAKSGGRGADFGICPDGTTCSFFDSNLYAISSFDSVGIAFIAFLQAVTFDDWAATMYALMSSFSPLAWVYFVLIVTIGGFFIINLFLAVIFLEFGHAQSVMEDVPTTAFDESKCVCAAASEADEEPQSPRSSSYMGGALMGSPGYDREAARVYSPTTFGRKDDADEAGSHSRTPLYPNGSVRSDEDNESLATRSSLGRSPGGTSSRMSTQLVWDKELRRYRKPLPTDNLPSAQDTILSAYLEPLAKSDALSNFSTSLVILNMVLMCMPFEGMTDTYSERLELWSGMITWLFIAEFAVKLIGLGFEAYWSDGWNVLDGTIVTLSLLEMVATAFASGTGIKLSFLRMLRMLRVLRVLRLMRKWRGLYTILSTFVQALPHMSNVALLELLTMFMFALLGMQLFGGIYNPRTGYSHEACPGGACPDPELEEKPYYHFDYCYPAMITVFTLLTGEWVDAVEPAAAILGPACSAFFIFAVLLGKYLLTNLLIAVFLHKFQEDDAPSTPRPVDALGGRGPSTNSMSPSSSPQPITTVETDFSLFCFGPKNSLRILSRWAVRQAWFDRVVILAIVCSSISLALDSPRLDPASRLFHSIRILDVFFTAFFVCEMCTKVIAFGFACNGPDSYLKSGWNQMDFLIVMISVVVLLSNSIPELQPLRAMRVMRVLRPLRLIARNDGMKLIITSLFKSMPAIANVLGVIFMLQVVFAILGMQLFSGTFGACNNPLIQARDLCVAYSGQLSGQQVSNDLLSSSQIDLRRVLKGGKLNSAVWDDSQQLAWTNPPSGSFDNFGDAMLLLYIMSSGDQWEIPLFTMMGARERGIAPQRNDFSLNALFGLAWMFCVRMRSRPEAKLPMICLNHSPELCSFPNLDFSHRFAGLYICRQSLCWRCCR